MKLIKKFLEFIGVLPEDFRLFPEWADILNWLGVYAKDIIIILLLGLLILKYLGFDGASKYIYLTLVIAVVIALLV